MFQTKGVKLSWYLKQGKVVPACSCPEFQNILFNDTASLRIWHGVGTGNVMFRKHSRNKLPGEKTSQCLCVYHKSHTKWSGFKAWRNFMKVTSSLLNNQTLCSWEWISCSVFVVYYEDYNKGLTYGEKWHQHYTILAWSKHSTVCVNWPLLSRLGKRNTIRPKKYAEEPTRKWKCKTFGTELRNILADFL